MLCYVTDRRSLAEDSVAAKKLLLEKIEKAAMAGVDWIQLREKDLSGRELAELTGAALQRIGGSSKFLINDRLDVACACNAAGVHLGENGLPVDEARRFADQRCGGKNYLVGVSAHSSQAAQQAETGGADYVIFGPVFATPSKARFGTPQGLAKLQEVCGSVRIPVLAIGGITVENAHECLEAGAGGIAAIRLFQDAADLKSVVEQLRKRD
jgi:thiamine-phosphate pyrophosphorylase